MRSRVAALTLFLLLPTALRAQAPPAPRPDEPVRVAYYYKVRWGFQDEFVRLFLKNHYPVLAGAASRIAAPSPPPTIRDA